MRTDRSVFHSLRSLNPTEKATWQIMELWRLHAKKTNKKNNVTIQVTAAILLVYASLASNVNLQRLVTHTGWQCRFSSLFCMECHLCPDWTPELSCLPVTAAYSRSSKQGTLPHGARQTAFTSNSFIWKRSHYTRRTFHGKRAGLPTTPYYVIVTFPFLAIWFDRRLAGWQCQAFQLKIPDHLSSQKMVAGSGLGMRLACNDAHTIACKIVVGRLSKNLLMNAQLHIYSASCRIP